MAPVKFLAAIFLVVAKLAAAQCVDPCGDVRLQYGTVCGVDPDDGSMFAQEVAVCPCSVGETFPVTVGFVGADGQATSSSTTTTFATASTTTSCFFDFGFANTAIPSGSLLTISFRPNHPAIYNTISPQSSIFFAEETDTVTVTSAGATTTSTITRRVTSTRTLAQKTTTSRCTTGTKTIHESPITTTKTRTFTPRRSTATVFHVEVKTVHRSCVSTRAQPGPEVRGKKADLDLAPRQYNQGTYETLWCPYFHGGRPPPPTTYTTGTTVVTSTVFTTDTESTRVTTTITKTSSPKPLTTTVCSDVERTKYTTHTFTKSASTVLKRRTTTKTVHHTITKTIYPNKHPTPCSKPPAPNQATQLVKPAILYPAKMN